MSEGLGFVSLEEYGREENAVNMMGEDGEGSEKINKEQ